MACAILCLLGADLLALSIIDAKTRRIPNACILVGIAIWLVALALEPDTSRITLLIRGLLGLVALVAVSLFCAELVKRFSGKEALGMGDVKLYGLAGLYLGLLPGFECMFLSCLFGLAFAGIQNLAQRFRGKARGNTQSNARNGAAPGTFPFGPAISLAFFIMLLIK